MIEVRYRAAVKESPERDIYAFPHVPRPPEVQYKYLRLSKEVASIVVEMHSEYQEYLASDGTMIMELGKMLYGMIKLVISFTVT